jgi:hypothetical protein
MDFETAYSYIESESNNELLVYVAIGCSLTTYPPNKHPPQQYPPYLREFDCPQICVLIDPRLEMPPRAVADVATLEADITFLPIQQEFNHTNQWGDSNAWFLDKIVKLCIKPDSRVKLIVQEFTGANIHLYYPLQYGRNILKNVLYDPNYSDGGCYVDFSKIHIYRDAAGGFIQPMYMPLHKLRFISPALVKEQVQGRFYPIVHLLWRLYKILHGREEVRDWCTMETVETRLQYMSFIYNIPRNEYITCLRDTLMASTRDIVILSGALFNDEQIHAIVESSGKELETLWTSVKQSL